MSETTDTAPPTEQPREVTVLDALTTVVAILVDVNDVTSPAVAVPPGMVGQVLAGAMRVADTIGAGATKLTSGQHAGAAAVLVQGALHQALAALQVLCAAHGIAVADLGFAVAGAPTAPAAPVLVGPDGGPVSAATAGDRRILTTLGG